MNTIQEVNSYQQWEEWKKNSWTVMGYRTLIIMQRFYGMSRLRLWRQQQKNYERLSQEYGQAILYNGKNANVLKLIALKL